MSALKYGWDTAVVVEREKGCVNPSNVYVVPQEIVYKKKIEYEILFRIWIILQINMIFFLK